MEKVKTYSDLRTWREAQRLVNEVYRQTASFPDSERFGLTNQIRRAAVSVPSNIAEGMGRGTAKDLMRFLVIARGSIHELLSELETAKRLAFISQSAFDELSEFYKGLNAGINAHLSSLQKYK